MLLVKTHLTLSSIHGIGLFASEPILRGTLVWRWNPRLDVLWLNHELAELPPALREAIQFWGYQDPKVPSGYILPGDGARHFNFSDNPNCGELYPDGEPASYALRDIAAGEELTFPFDEDLSAFRRGDLREFHKIHANAR